jgi:hypothetical protein
LHGVEHQAGGLAVDLADGEAGGPHLPLMVEYIPKIKRGVPHFSRLLREVGPLTFIGHGMNVRASFKARRSEFLSSLESRGPHFVKDARYGAPDNGGMVQGRSKSQSVWRCGIPPLRKERARIGRPTFLPAPASP